MPTFKYTMSGYVSDKAMNYIRNDLIDIANVFFHPDLYPITIRRIERNSSESTFYIVFQEKVGETYPDYYIGQLEANKTLIAAARDSYEAISEDALLED